MFNNAAAKWCYNSNSTHTHILSTWLALLLKAWVGDRKKLVAGNEGNKYVDRVSNFIYIA